MKSTRWFAQFATCLALALPPLGGAAVAAAEFTVVPRVPVANPPPVQCLVPGFTVREVPLALNNLNSLACAPDGRIFALAYDGNVWQLHDTAGDRLPIRATKFYDNPHNEIRPSIGMAWGPGGLYIASQGRVIRLRDQGDGTGQLETLAGGWVGPAVAAGSSLDAVGCAVDAAGNVYFGLGCDAYNGAYRVDPATDQSAYRLAGDRGTIQKLSADGKTRETVVTGVRFTVALAFNAAGDLFATDQEGATWLPNGNPFDELLHLQTGRHYGFPPRHPKYLPGVIDEPSVFDYGPQHQSTCGLHFNESAGPARPVFGPAWWRGDALVAGESRGKIWRTKLVKTAAGYIAQNQVFACLQMLTIDALPTPRGDLLVACHSGQPDWGTGPGGKGKLFLLSPAPAGAPQPVLTYNTSPTEIQVVFDAPVEPARFRNLTGRASLTVGRHVAAGDRFETFQPGYQAVKEQMAVPQFAVPILSAALAADHRSLTLRTAPRTTALSGALVLPEPGHEVSPANAPADPAPSAPARPFAQMDLATDLNGLTADWQPTGRGAGTNAPWNGWLPHLDLDVAWALTTASDEHRRAFAAMDAPGRLNLHGQLDLSLLLHPATQPGAHLAYEYLPEVATVVLRAVTPLQVTAGAGARAEQVGPGEWHLTVTPKPGEWIPFEVRLNTIRGRPRLEAFWFTAEDHRPRALPLRRFLLPWARPEAAPLAGEMSAVPGRQIVPEIAGGDWERGRVLFASEPANCAKCHQIRGTGGRIGPDLSNLTQRDYASVMRDITQPSAAINPDYLTYNVGLRGGETVSGVLVADTPAQLVLHQVTGETITIPKSRTTYIQPSAASLMPEGLLNGLTPAQQRDLLTFLLLEPPTNSPTPSK